MELKPITISFKNNTDEIALYEVISKHSSKGAFIKDTLIEILVKKNVGESNVSTNDKKIENNADELSEILDM